MGGDDLIVEVGLGRFVFNAARALLTVDEARFSTSRLRWMKMLIRSLLREYSTTP